MTKKDQKAPEARFSGLFLIRRIIAKFAVYSDDVFRRVFYRVPYTESKS